MAIEIWTWKRPQKLMKMWDKTADSEKRENEWIFSHSRKIFFVKMQKHTLFLKKVCKMKKNQEN